MSSPYPNTDFDTYLSSLHIDGKRAEDNLYSNFYKSSNNYRGIDILDSKFDEYDQIERKQRNNLYYSSSYSTYYVSNPFYEDTYHPSKQNNQNKQIELPIKIENTIERKIDIISEDEEKEPYSEISSLSKTTGSLNQFDAETSQQIKSKLQKLKMDLDKSCGVDEKQTSKTKELKKKASIKRQAPLAPKKEPEPEVSQTSEHKDDQSTHAKEQNKSAMLNMMNIRQKHKEETPQKTSRSNVTHSTLQQTTNKIYIQPGVQPYIVASGPDKAEMESHYRQHSSHSNVQHHRHDDNDNTSAFEQNVKMRSKKHQRLVDLRSNILSVGNMKQSTPKKFRQASSMINRSPKTDNKETKDMNVDSDISSLKHSRRNSIRDSMKTIKKKLKVKKSASVQKAKDFKTKIGRKSSKQSRNEDKEESNSVEYGETETIRRSELPSSFSNMVAPDEVESFFPVVDQGFSGSESDYEAFDALSLDIQSKRNEFSKRDDTMADSDYLRLPRVALDSGSNNEDEVINHTDVNEMYGSFGSRSNKSRNSIILDNILMIKDTQSIPNNDSMFHQESTFKAVPVIPVQTRNDQRSAYTHNVILEEPDNNKSGTKLKNNYLSSDL